MAKYNYAVTGPKGAKYETTTLAEAKELTRNGGSYRKIGGKARNPGSGSGKGHVSPVTTKWKTIYSDGELDIDAQRSRGQSQVLVEIYDRNEHTHEGAYISAMQDFAFHTYVHELPEDQFQIALDKLEESIGLADRKKNPVGNYQWTSEIDSEGWETWKLRQPGVTYDVSSQGPADEYATWTIYAIPHEGHGMVYLGGANDRDSGKRIAEGVAGLVKHLKRKNPEACYAALERIPTQTLVAYAAMLEGMPAGAYSAQEQANLQLLHDEIASRGATRNPSVQDSVFMPSEQWQKVPEHKSARAAQGQWNRHLRNDPDIMAMVTKESGTVYSWYVADLREGEVVKRGKAAKLNEAKAQCDSELINQAGKWAQGHGPHRG